MGDGQHPTEGDSRLRGTREPLQQATDVDLLLSAVLRHRACRVASFINGWPALMGQVPFWQPS